MEGIGVMDMRLNTGMSTENQPQNLCADFLFCGREGSNLELDRQRSDAVCARDFGVFSCLFCCI